MAAPDIPTIDLSGLVANEPGQLARIGREIGEIYSTVGFAYVTNHGVSQPLIDAAFAASQQFHALPLDEKLAIEINDAHRGYIPINTSTTVTSSVDRVTRPNQSASLMVMHKVHDDDPRIVQGVYLAGPNQWPASLPEIKAPLMAYVASMERLGLSLVGAIEITLGAEPGSLLQHFQTPTTFLRLLHYPTSGGGSNTDADDGAFGSAPHSDYGFLTLLAQDDVGGLQVRGHENTWIDVPPVEGTFVLNTADILHRWSNGRLISTPHRVGASKGAERYSLPFFFDPDVRSTVAPLPSCVDAGEAPAFTPVVYGDYLMHRLRSNHTQHQGGGMALGRSDSDR
jgi:isopenicillin N synthase-like dioxygenase